MASIQGFSSSNKVDSPKNLDEMKSVVTGNWLNLKPELDYLSINLHVLSLTPAHWDIKYIKVIPWYEYDIDEYEAKPSTSVNNYDIIRVNVE